MRAMRAVSFTGYGALKLVEVPRPRVTAGRILVRITAAGVSPLDHTILSGGFPFATPPLILGNEGAGVVESPGDSSFPAGARVMFFGPYGVSENGTYSESIAVRREDLFLIPDNLDDATAGGMPVAYLTAQITLMQAGFAPGKIVLAPAIGGAVGNAVTQLARAQGAGMACTIARGQSGRMGRHPAAARPGSGQADRRTNVQVGRISRGTTPSDRRPSVRQGRSG